MGKCFLRKTKKTSRAYGLAIDSLKKDDLDGSTGLLAELGLAELHETSDHDAINHLSPFSEATSGTFEETFKTSK